MPNPTRARTGAKPRTVRERRFRRFTVKLPVTVATDPVPPYWIPLQIRGETIEMGQGGVSVRFPFDVTRYLQPRQLVRLWLRTSDDDADQQCVKARVVWIEGRRVGFEFTRVVRGRDGTSLSDLLQRSYGDK